MITNNYIFSNFINCYKNETFEIIHVVKEDNNIEEETQFSMNADEAVKFFENTCYKEIKDYEDYIKIIIGDGNYYLLGV